MRVIHMDWQLRTSDGDVIGDYLYFSNNAFNGLFRMDLAHHDAELVGFFPDEEIDRWAMHKKCIRYEDKLVFLPLLGSHIHIFDSATGNFTTIDVAAWDGFEKNEVRVSDAVLIDDMVYIFPVRYSGSLYCLNMNSFFLDEIYEFKEQMRAYSKNVDDIAITRVEKDKYGNICFAILGTNILAVWDVENKKLGIDKCEVDNLFSTHLIDDEQWFFKRSGSDIYKLDGDKNIERIAFATKKNDDVRYYNRLISFYGKIIALPAFYDFVACIDEKRLHDLVRIDAPKTENESAITFEVVEVYGKLWILPYLSEYAYVLDKDLRLIDKVSFELTDDVSKIRVLRKFNSVITRKAFESERLLCESENNSLDDILCYLTEEI